MTVSVSPVSLPPPRPRTPPGPARTDGLGTRPECAQQRPAACESADAHASRERPAGSGWHTWQTTACTQATRPAGDPSPPAPAGCERELVPRCGNDARGSRQMRGAYQGGQVAKDGDAVSEGTDPRGHVVAPRGGQHDWRPPDDMEGKHPLPVSGRGGGAGAQDGPLLHKRAAERHGRVGRRRRRLPRVSATHVGVRRLSRRFGMSSAPREGRPSVCLVARTRARQRTGWSASWANRYRWVAVTAT